ncbi:OmpA family protein [Sediminitomix flava]|nr:OmpA family protein [Sediminitomix flava]
MSQSYGQEKEHTPFEATYFKGKTDKMKKGRKSFQLGKQYMELDRNYKEALKEFKKAERYNPTHNELIYKMGVCYFYQKKPDLKLAIEYFNKAKQISPLFSSNVHYLLARAHHLQKEWDEASTSYQLYGASFADSTEQWLLAQKRVEECHNGKMVAGTGLRLKIENIARVNSSSDDIGPVINRKETRMYITSRRDKSTGYDTQDGQYYEDIFVSKKSRSGDWYSPKPLGANVNTKGHDAVIGISPSEKTLMIYRGDNNGDIFLSRITKKGEVKTPERMPSPVNTDFRETSASFTGTGQVIFFTSDRPNGKGGLDIWSSKQFRNKKGKREWKEPVNLEILNTPYDEDGVFLTRDGKTLYFSSKGHNSIGGYDIFKSEKKGNKWTKPINLGDGINTPDDDIFISVSEDEKRIYFSSKNMGGKGGFDIFVAHLIGEERIPQFTQEAPLVASITPEIDHQFLVADLNLSSYHAKILDKDSKKPLFAKATVINNNSQEKIGIFYSDDLTGDLAFTAPSEGNYSITIEAADHLFVSENLYSEQGKALVINKEILMQPISKGSQIILNNMFYESSSATLSASSKADLNNLISFLRENPSVRIEIAGHTDNVGSKTKNEILSHQRAKSVVDYLVKNKVDRRRLKVNGYGDTKPIASNETEEGRRQNRRTELRIIN